jgi:uncharacterized protein (TIGR04168 family)
MSEAVTRPINLAIVGDVHHQWDAIDHAALESLGVDLVLFVGDYGNEAIAVVRQISQLNLPKAAILGNHDVWYSVTHKGKEHAPEPRDLDRMQLQLDLLGDCHVGYGFKDFPELGLSVVGARPCSWGGDVWKYRKFCKDRFGVHSFQESANKIARSIAQTAFDQVMMIGHNGPFGLGATAESICGKDWGEAMDFGDPDFAAAIAQAPDLGKRIPLVTFGHMHHRLKSGEPRITERTIGATCYFNAACVPRHRTIAGEPVRHFGLITLAQGKVTETRQAWVNAQGKVIATNPNMTGPNMTAPNPASPI